MINNMKIIDLLNKIANCEGVPERIKVDNIIYRYENWEQFYYTDNEAREDLLVRGKDYSTNDFLNWKVEVIEENQDIDIQSIEHNELDILQEILGKCDLWKGNEGYILKVINENNNRLVDAILKVSKENETLTRAIKQLDRQINNN